MTASQEPVPGDGRPSAVCVVVSTYNRAELLPDLVSALKAQDHPDYEVVVVDNGSTDGTSDVLTDLVQGDERFRTFRLADNRGPAMARNLGWQSTSRPWIAFTDDDCVPTRTWLTELVSSVAGASIVQGRTAPVTADWLQRRWFDRSQLIQAWSGRFETCNLLVRRDLLQRLHGFDPTFRAAMGEDTDLGLRAVRLGATTAFAETAVVHHRVWRTGYRGFLEHRRRHADLVPLFRENPEARDLLFWRLFVVRKHLFFWALVPATALSLWAGMPWIPGLLAVSWCVWNTFQTRYLPFSPVSRLLRSALLLIGYAYETWCFAVASVRHRTLVL